MVSNFFFNSSVVILIRCFNALISTIRGEKVSKASAIRKGKYGRKPDFSLVVRLNETEHEIFYLETGTPISKLDKQLRDHRKLARFSKDSVDQTRGNKLKTIFKKNKDLATIFTMNVTGMCNFISIHLLNLIRCNIEMYFTLYY
jgi:hypothetical protein